MQTLTTWSASLLKVSAAPLYPTGTGVECRPSTIMRDMMKIVEQWMQQIRCNEIRFHATTHPARQCLIANNALPRAWPPKRGIRDQVTGDWANRCSGGRRLQHASASLSTHQDASIILNREARKLGPSIFSMVNEVVCITIILHPIVSRTFQGRLRFIPWIRYPPSSAPFLTKTISALHP